MTLKDEKLYYVGGVVRDEILNRPSVDVDYCYEGNAIEFAQKFDIIRTNLDFGTVKVRYEDKDIDIASTRKEIYPRKGHLPKVLQIGCSLEEDLKRRDFTINALAKRTTDGEIIDLYNGKKDLENKVLRVLHEESFIDDPTRIIRGLKFTVRFGFKLDEGTKRLQEEYLSNINYDMCYHRLKKELVETFNLNREEAYRGFVNSGMYKLLGENQEKPKLDYSFEKIINSYPCKHVWLMYLFMFDLSNLELTRAEKRVLEWFERLKTEKPTNNTPYESILMHKIYKGSL